VPASLVFIRDNAGFCSDEMELNSAHEYQVTVDGVCFRIELQCGRVFHLEKVIVNFAGREREDIVGELLAFVRMPETRTVEFSMEERLLTITPPPSEGERRYTFFAKGRPVAAATAAPTWQVSDLKIGILSSLHRSEMLPGCISLRFWDTELLNGTTVGDYQIPSGAGILVVDADTRELTVVPSNAVVRMGPADTVADLKRFFARREKLRPQDFTVASPRDIPDTALLWSIDPPIVTVSYSSLDLTFECGAE
jgi:hypothetical protein